jgi:hypothetical protein
VNAGADPYNQTPPAYEENGFSLPASQAFDEDIPF